MYRSPVVQAINPNILPARPGMARALTQRLQRQYR